MAAMIGLRRTIERGMRHRWLGPIVVVLVFLLLAFLYLHALQDGHADANLGEFCLGVTMLIGILLIVRVRFRAPPPMVLVRPGRAPPCPDNLSRRPVSAAAAVTVIPLRL